MWWLRGNSDPAENENLFIQLNKLFWLHCWYKGIKTNVSHVICSATHCNLKKKLQVKEKGNMYYSRYVLLYLSESRYCSNYELGTKNINFDYNS